MNLIEGKPTFYAAWENAAITCLPWSTVTADVRSVFVSVVKHLGKHRDFMFGIHSYHHKVCHQRCVYYELYWSVYTCLTQLYDGRDMYSIYYIKNNYIFSALFIGHLQVEKWRNLVSSHTRLMWVVYSGEVRGEVGTSV